MKNKFALLLIGSFLLLGWGLIAYAGTSSVSKNRYSGGTISSSPSEKVTAEKDICESGQTCHGETNWWRDSTSTSCGKGTFTLTKKTPKSAASDYCVPESAKNGKSSKISSGKSIVDAYSSPTATVIGTCYCLVGDVVVTEEVSVELAQVLLFGTSKK